MSLDPAEQITPGIDMELGGTTLTVPPLPLGALRELAKFSDAAKDGGVGVPESIDALIQAMHRTLKRNYPRITIEEIEDLIDVNTAMRIFGKLGQLSGLSPQQAEGAKPMGESNGGSSTDG